MAPRTPTPELDARFSAADAAPTPWADVYTALQDAELFWISTVRADGRPHVAPLPAVWHATTLYFCTGPQEQKVVNLRANHHCILTTGTNRWKCGLDIVVEGGATRVTDNPRDVKPGTLVRSERLFGFPHQLAEWLRRESRALA